MMAASGGRSTRSALPLAKVSCAPLLGFTPYTHPLLAVLNPIHARIAQPRLFEAEGIVGKKEYDLKVGCTELTLIREIQLPEVTTEERIKFGILCAKAGYADPGWNTWADDWLSVKDRSEGAAWAAAAARSAAEAAAEAAAWAAVRVATVGADLVKIAEQACSPINGL